ncbi:MAG: prenyltransferase [Anaerolineales bacterium]|nr:prenyltransferase [Anaerolineales bacterium]
MMNISMWIKALQIIPHVEKAEWQRLDVLSKWLISTRAAVLIMTFLSGAIAGILAYQQGDFSFLPWFLATIGIVLAHATNNLLNDYTDAARGVDQENYYRAQYGPQPLLHGLMSKRQHLTYSAVTGGLALAIGIYLVFYRGGLTLPLLLAGAFFVLFYTWPLKYIALGEIAVLIVWGPLMIGGVFYEVTGNWDWNVVLAGLPYALGVTGVIFGKHIDKLDMDRAKRIYTLPVLMGDRASRAIVLGMLAAQYLLVVYLVAEGFFSPVMLGVLLAVPAFLRVLPIFRAPKPLEKPLDFPDVWPNYYVAAAFFHNRRFGLFYLGGLILSLFLR